MKPSAALGFIGDETRQAAINSQQETKKANEHNYNKERNAVNAAKHRGNRRDGVFD
jgi:hypothetical protein